MVSVSKTTTNTGGMNDSTNHSSGMEEEEVQHGNVLTGEGGGGGGGDYVPLRTQLCSELVGTYILVLIGCGAACASLYGDPKTMGGSSDSIPLLWAVGATLGIYSAASISGGHLNPAVTLAFALIRPTAFPLNKVVPYWGAQIGGALLAGLTNLVLFHKAIVDFEDKLVERIVPTKCKVDGHFVFGSKSGKISECQVYDDLRVWSAFADTWNNTSLGEKQGYVVPVSNEFHAMFIEAFGTAFVVFVIFIVTSPFYPIPGPAVPPVVALALGAMMYVVGPLTGYHLNPAGDIGLRCAGTLWLLLREGRGTIIGDLTTNMGRIIHTMWRDGRVYILGPMIGGPIGAWIAEAIQHVY